MNSHFREAFLTAWQSPLRLDAEINSPSATEEALLQFESDFGPIPPTFRWFLANCGGGVVGSEWVDDIVELSETHRRFREEFPASVGLFVIGWDGRGDPFGIDAASEKVLGVDHDNGNLFEVAPNFEAFLAKVLANS
ncbi:MAG: SMI1/KNR4 family protein [Paludisphaera borealis]|uniref:SMI1/KNR4 family protein n=1 Tax=Paludisphaera borealis TaxID=1387353 RepID=UPI00283AF07A|nr:SMI1/KNR4 family protein [Paludisphaera borealis]MDR3619545.1 SMI1/KNR4 family protein [Paludisphaera borealis]